jgi:hypothetical protein
MKKYIILFYTLLFTISSIASNVNTNWGNDSLEISLLTCSPGKDLYSMFGHSGIRVNNITQGEDIVFNYGMFNYNSDNFIFRFVKGETDYELGAEDAINFFGRYRAMKHIVEEQILNLTHDEKVRLTWLLLENYKPENRVYRYNFLYDNCTTRARDAIEKAINDCSRNIYYDNIDEKCTFRDILHKFTAPYPWVEFGIDMLLGAEVDRYTSREERMFIPSLYRNDVDGATVCNNNDEHCTLLKGTCIIYPCENSKADDIEASPFTPIVTFWGIFLLSLALSTIDVLRKRISWWWDMVLMFTQGTAGIIISFLFFFSEHPAVGSNWLVVIFNPLPLIFIYWIVKNKRKCQTCWVSTINTIVLTTFTLAIPLIPQWINPAMIPLVLSLLIRAISGEIVTRPLPWIRKIKR